MKILIGYDGSDSAIEAIEQLQWAGLPGDTKAEVVSAADVWPPLPASAFENVSRSDDPPMVRKAHALAMESFAQAKDLAAAGEALVKKTFPNWTVTSHAHAGSPTSALIEPGDAPDLIVVGSQGRSTLGRIALGSVSQSVLTHSPSSVRVSRKNPGTRQYANSPVRIVLGVDGSAMSLKAVKAVAARAWPKGSEVKLVAALDPKFWAVLSEANASPWTLAYLGEAEEEGRAVAEKAISETAKELTAAGLKTTTVVEESPPKRLILTTAEAWAADCIVLGAKGHNRLDRILLGSVSTAVATRAHCAVEIVR